MKYNVGDKVRIKSKEWFDEYRQLLTDGICGVAPDRKNEQRFTFNASMSEHCGCSAEIMIATRRFYKIDLDGGIFFWEDWMFED